jgi:5-methylcytosine-specific restriction endonuclease McrA
VVQGTCTTDGCDRPLRYKGLCKPHYQRQWYEKNREHALSYAKDRYDSQAARERHQRLKDDPDYLARKKAAYDRWRADNPDKAKAAYDAWRAANPDRTRQTRRAWYEANKLKVREKGRRRRAAVLNASDGVVDYEALLEEHGMVCHICSGEIPTRADLHFDHVIPLARGGRHSPGNIRPAHAFCNLSKHDRLLDEERGA